MVSLNVKGSLPIRVAWVWTIVFIGIVLYAMAWYVFGWMIWTVIEAVEAAFTFPPPLDNVVVVIKHVIAWHPILALFGWLIWGYINSARRDVRQYEV